MSSREDQPREEALLNAEEEAACRTFTHDPGEGEVDGPRPLLRKGVHQWR